MSEKFDLLKELNELREIVDKAYSDQEQELSDELGFDLSEFEDTNQFVGDGKITIDFVSTNEKELSYAYESDSGFDLYSNEEVKIPAFGRALIPTGISVDLPQDYEIQVRSKSGLAINQGLMVLNSPGTVDEGYTGEIKAIIFNTNNHEFVITKGMKVAQAVVARCITGRWVRLNKVDKIEDKDRGSNGFGSTGI
jgi:dUTP pyrophosphatase